MQGFSAAITLLQTELAACRGGANRSARRRCVSLGISERLMELEFLDISEGRSKRLENLHLASAATGEADE